LDCLLSVIIRTKNEGKLLWRVLKALTEQDFSHNFEIIVVDSGSTDNTLETAKNYGTKIIQIKPEDFTFGYGLNVGADAAKGRYLLNLSGHAIPATNQYLSIMVNGFYDEKVAGVYGRDIPHPGCCPGQAKDMHYGYPAGQTYPRVLFSSANGAIRKDIWEKIPFDEKLIAAEDLLWAVKVMKLGYSIGYLPEATVYHSHSASLKFAYRKSWIESRAILQIYHLEGLKMLKDAGELERVKELASWFERMKNLKEGLRWFIYQTLHDFKFALLHKYKFYWFPHIPMYRATQTLAMYQGAKEV